jgi:hypothetical protein
MNESNWSKMNPTSKTKEELLVTKPDELSPTERYLQGLLKDYPGLTLEEAIEILYCLP